MLFIFLLGEIPGWILMAKEWRFFYPMTVKTYISWSPKKYEMGMGGISTLLLKVALNDWVMKSYWNKINFGNGTEQSAIWSVIIQVISE